VFTLTGMDIPDEIKIQIMTISGRIVREITQDELGPIKIGNNISDFAWDGRDETEISWQMGSIYTALSP